MAPAEVLPNSSRKQGHLEAGKKKLEEFRKRKAEERAKKAGYTVPSQSIDEGNNGNSSLNHEHEGDRKTSSTSISFFEPQTTPVEKYVFSSTDKHVISSNENAQMSNSYEKSGHKGLVNGNHGHWKDSSELFDNDPSNFETASIATLHPFIASDSVHANVDLEATLDSSSLYPASSEKNRNSSSALIGYVDASSAAGLQKSETASAESRFGLPNTSLNSSSAFTDSSPGLGVYNPSSFNNETIVDSQVGWKTISESISQHLNLGNASWHSSDSLTDSSLPIRRAQEAYSSPSTSYEVISGRSRPSFLYTLGVSKGPSTSHVPPNPPVSFSDSKVQSTAVHFPSHQPPFTNMGNLQQPSNLSPSDLANEKINFSVSNDIQMLERNRDYLQGSHENLVPKKDEEFSALEQHIEDLTQEKFALQRALDTSKTLAESLASENLSLKESSTQQANVCSELRSEIEGLQEEVNYQMRAVESLKLEYGNAQLECSAADERAKILASEVIELEEKALRLRSNELKLEKQLEELASEISSYKRKVSSLEKERQDFQSTINLMQEEKKVLQFKLRKAASNSKDDDTIKVSSSRRDMSTSTVDLGDDLGRHINEAEIMTSNTVSVLRSEPASNDLATSTSSLRNGRSFFLPDGSVGIPHDQLRMIDNINSLLSELAVEKEELMHALTIESSNGLKLKDLNKELSQKLDVQTQRLEQLTSQRMANNHTKTKQVDTYMSPDIMEYADEGDEVVERVLGWIMKFFPGGSSKRRPSKLLRPQNQTYRLMH
ncbi:hypothetical protein KSP39_PZI021511 [Platanthera zijinensis]|uniref:BLISTER n=1 Tax=Platanthera zijinensis TaxID=2320716 RepID=A0AAP0AYQ3_9ASPA